MVSISCGEPQPLPPFRPILSLDGWQHYIPPHHHFHKVFCFFSPEKCLPLFMREKFKHRLRKGYLINSLNMQIGVNSITPRKNWSECQTSGSKRVSVRGEIPRYSGLLVVLVVEGGW